MRLIYHCGRLRAKGYATFLGTNGKTGSGEPGVDQLWQAVQRGEPKPGSTGIVRRLAAEGREIVEILVLEHGRSLTGAQTATLEAALGRIFDHALATALKTANAPNISHTAAQAMMEAALTAALPALAPQIPPSARKIVTAPPKPPAGKRWKRTVTLAGAGAALLLLLGGIFALRWTDTPDDQTAQTEATAPEPMPPSAETTDAVGDFLRACHGEPDPAVVETLAAAFAGLGPTKATDGLRDRLQLLELADRETLPDLAGQDDKTICSERQTLWQAIEALRPHASGTGPQPYSDVSADLENRSQDLMLIKVAVAAASVPAPPIAPPDCALNKCFPILHPADLAALRWIDGVHKAMTAPLATEATVSPPESNPTDALLSHAEALRGAEVRLRGELALAGITPDHPVWLKQLWDCEGRAHLATCSFPLAEATAWARRQQ